MINILSIALLLNKEEKQSTLQMTIVKLDDISGIDLVFHWGQKSLLKIWKGMGEQIILLKKLMMKLSY